MEYLQSEKTIIIEDAKDINNFKNEIKQAKQSTGGIVYEKSKANVFCYRDGRCVTSFTVYDNSTIETEQKQRTRYYFGLKSLRKLTPQIRLFELRMQCAANLKNLWHRLRLYDRADKNRLQYFKNIRFEDQNKPNDPNDNVLEFKKKLEEEMQWALESRKKLYKDLYRSINLVYPPPGIWCDAMEWAYLEPGVKSKRSELRRKSHTCPSAGEGKNHYAMNPNCKPDSLGDMVLLFETKAGWNQNGGPELFTFDNHEPKGGCVLLNDGTVKFIRTKEELNQLRWK